ncbi:ACP S-malonyltransferase [Convivina intestini]|uniref:Malonyl CoA-acyl carrier protein transacylase n=1 Tax=Convivina intestini TaxID=1505726 RepID=A0A2U1D7R0_9LACO|nr:ACP S-malonyltransferase [Convivina intestini]PVY83715.1 [acyl-carrier-protein] S-malonyltransferase [Convivina intestini]CAH1855105.1 Malonyl CoA-acyl carrier protein transacylase [Convivina intestini]SDB92349.1 [acyl-carrier-protein] S-malonyltransferase [Leuconostocaceae bacterium R-53105]
MKIGLMFSGQGAQQVDMGMDFYQSLPAYRTLIDQASQQLGYDLTEVVQDESKIKQTEFAQPAIVAMSLAIVQALGADLPKPVASVGLSLGEYSALAAAGAMTFDQALAIIKDRGRYMQEVGDQNPGKMVAVMGDDQDLIVTTLKKLQERGLQVYPANFNTFAQLVIGGVAADVDQAVGELTAAGIKRMVELPVVGAFHTPLLNEAALRLQNRLADETFQPLLYPVYSNTTKQPFIIDQLKDTLKKQIVSPTYFSQDLQAMLDQGVDTLIEIGPAATLVKFAKKIAPKEVARYSITDLDSFQEVQEMLSAGKE